MDIINGSPLIVNRLFLHPGFADAALLLPPPPLLLFGSPPHFLRKSATNEPPAAAAAAPSSAEGQRSARQETLCFHLCFKKPRPPAQSERSKKFRELDRLGVGAADTSTELQGFICPSAVVGVLTLSSQLMFHFCIDECKAIRQGRWFSCWQSL